VNEGRQRLNVIHQSLVRPVLLAGAERPLALANWIAAAALILGGGRWYTAALGVLLAPPATGHWSRPRKSIRS
jgi:type IV secretory pathway TrbD component